MYSAIQLVQLLVNWAWGFNCKNPKVRPCGIDQVIKYGKAEVWEFPVKTERSRWRPGSLTPYFTWAESSVNEGEQKVFLICIPFGSCEVQRLTSA